jgi:hypothetical protein
MKTSRPASHKPERAFSPPKGAGLPAPPRQAGGGTAAEWEARGAVPMRAKPFDEAERWSPTRHVAADLIRAGSATGAPTQLVPPMRVRTSEVEPFPEAPFSNAGFIQPPELRQPLLLPDGPGVPTFARVNNRKMRPSVARCHKCRSPLQFRHLPKTCPYCRRANGFARLTPEASLKSVALAYTFAPPRWHRFLGSLQSLSSRTLLTRKACAACQTQPRADGPFPHGSCLNSAFSECNQDASAVSLAESQKTFIAPAATRCHDRPQRRTEP